MTEVKERSFITKALLWCGSTIGVFFLVGRIFFERTSFGAVIFAVSMGLMATFAFCLTDLFANKTAARVIYVLACGGIIFCYWNGARP